MNHGEKEHKIHDLVLEVLQMARKESNKYRMKALGFINKKLQEKNEARWYIKNANEAMLESYWVFTKQLKHLTLELQLLNFYHASEDPKNFELLFVTVGTGLARYALYKYLK